MRLIRATGDESYEEDFADDSAAQSLSVSAPSTSQSLAKSGSYEDQTQYFQKKQPPSDVEKMAIREQMFDFFSSARGIESEMVRSFHLQIISITPHSFEVG